MAFTLSPGLRYLHCGTFVALFGASLELGLPGPFQHPSFPLGRAFISPARPGGYEQWALGVFLGKDKSNPKQVACLRAEESGFPLG